MRLKVLIIAVFIFLLLEIYTYQAIKTLTANPLVLTAYMTISLGVLAFIIFKTLGVYSSNEKSMSSVQIAMLLTVLIYVPKLIIGITMLLEDVFRILEYTFHHYTQDISLRNDLHGRRKFISVMGLGLAAIPFFGVLHGYFFGKYNYRVIKQVLFFKDLPESFDGFRLAQISDVHSGSFDNPQKVQHGLDLLNQQKADVIFFTGDLVNNMASEMKPWINHFKQLKASKGIFSILGNHDYGDYIRWESPVEKQKNMQDLYLTHQAIGFDLLRNQHKKITINNQSINIIGVENWGIKPFPQLGDLNKAMYGIGEGEFNLLLSHDPTHFDEIVKHHDKKVHLTLSGHTHGMQFGIEIPGIIKWSPVKFKYPKWAGLYEDNNKYLYVNRGFGYLGLPSRVGMPPEITVIELRKG